MQRLVSISQLDHISEKKEEKMWHGYILLQLLESFDSIKFEAIKPSLEQFGLYLEENKEFCKCPAMMTSVKYSLVLKKCIIECCALKAPTKDMFVKFISQLSGISISEYVQTFEIFNSGDECYAYYKNHKLEWEEPNEI